MATAAALPGVTDVVPECAVVASGFTSVIDVAFDRRGTMYVTELDEASWFAVEVTFNPIGGTVNACTLNAGSWDCAPLEQNLATPTGVASDATGRVYVTNHSLEPGAAGCPIPCRTDTPGESLPCHDYVLHV